MKLSELCARPAVAALVRCGDRLPDLEVEDVTDDSRHCAPSVIFAATLSGRTYLPQAIRAGSRVLLLAEEDHAAQAELGSFSGAVLTCSDVARAVGQLAAELCGRPTDQLEVTAVTGTNGKTSFAWLLHHARLVQGVPSGMIGTLGVFYRDASGEDVAVKTGYTTPRAPQLQRLLREMLDRGVRHVVMEASSEGLDLGRLWGCRFACAVFTNLTRDHLDHHGTMEHYYQSKRRLFLETAAAGGRLILCAEDEAGARLGREFPSAEVLTTDEIEAMPFPARFQRINAALVARVLGPDNSDGEAHLRSLLSSLPGVPGRFCVVMPGGTAPSCLLGVVDYAHTPDAVSNLLASVRDMPAAHVVCVIGCGGDRDPGKREPMGEAAARLADCVIVTDDNPRSEDPAVIRAAVLAGAQRERERLGKSGAVQGNRPPHDRHPEICEVAGRREAIRAAVAWARAVMKRDADAGRCVVVVAGKGHEEEQIFAQGRREPFSDTRELQDALDAEATPSARP